MPLNRRTFLRSASIAIGLPLLDAMIPVGLGAEEQAEALRPRRLVLIGRPLGLHTPFLFPTKPGKDYETSRYLKPLHDLRDDFTVFSGMSHRGYNNGHGASVALMTGVAADAFRGNDVRNTISLDQEAAAKLGGETRFPCLVLGGGDQAWNRKGLRVPSESNAVRVFKQLFIDGTPAEVAREIERIEMGESILDGVRDQAKALALSLGPTDRDRLDLMLTSIREAEERLRQDRAWVRKPKPKVDVKPFADDYTTGPRMLLRERQWYDLVHLALQTDSTRIVSLFLWSHMEGVGLDGVNLAHHDASHHGQSDEKIGQLALIEEAEMKLFAGFLAKLKASKEGEQSLLDRTVVFHGSSLGNASAHTCDNLPIVLAGGGFRHAGHVAFDRKDNKPLSNLFVRMAQQVGLEIDRFGSSTSVLGEV